MIAHRLVSRLPVRSGKDFVRLELQVVPQAAQDIRIVLDNENPAHQLSPPGFVSNPCSRKCESKQNATRNPLCLMV